MGKTGLKKRCLLLGGGDIYDYAAVSERVDDSFFVICADSGIVHCEKLGVKPELLVGDFDSIKHIPEDVKTVPFPAEKDYTDSYLAATTAMDMGFDSILFSGMLGGRFDHSLSNLQTLAYCIEKGIDASFFDGKTEIFAVKNGTVTLSPREHTYFSVLSLTTSCKSVTITGAKYPLDAYPLFCTDPRAISNEFAGGTVTVTVEDGIIAVVVSGKK